MQKIFLLWSLLIVWTYGSTQTITIKDYESGEPLEMVTLMSEKPYAFTTTNTAGQAEISVFKNSERIEIRSLGYRTEVKSYSELKDLSFDISLKLSSINLDGIVVSATRWNQNSNDLPAEIISISAKEVKLQNPQTAADLLGISGKIFIQKSQQGGGSPMIRGFATNRLLYTIDGVRMNTAIFRSGNIQNVISLDPLSIENTEVYFGPGSVIYGSDAIGGVMSFRTLTPQLSLDNKPFVTSKVITRFSSANNEVTIHSDINFGWKKWAFITSTTSSDYGDLKMGSNGPDEYLRPFYVQRIDSIDVVVTNEDPKVQRPSGYSQVNIMQKIRFKPNNNWDFQYGFHYSETSSYSRYDRHIRYKNGLPRYGEWYYGPQKWVMNNLNITNSRGNNLYDNLTLRLAYQIFEESRVSRDINKPDREIRTENVDAYSANLDFIKKANTRNQLSYGLEIVWDDVTSRGVNEDITAGIKVDGPSRYPQSTWASYGIYATDQYRISEKYLLQAGIRYNQYLLDAKFDTTFYPFPFTSASMNTGAVTGSLGLVYKPASSWVISAGCATAFRSPNVDDMGKVFDSEPGAVTVPNPDLKAEYAYDADLSIAKTFGDVIKIDLTGYYTLLQNAMVRRDYQLNGLDSILYDGKLSKVQSLQNAAVAHVYGIQAGIDVSISKGFGFSSDFNFQKGEEELDDGTTSPSRHAAPMFGVSRLYYDLGKVSMQLYAEYSGGKTYSDLPYEEKAKTEIYAIDSNGNPYSPAWYTLNFKAMWVFSDDMKITAGIENLTDIRYRPYSSGIVAPGRNFMVSLRTNF